MPKTRPKAKPAASSVKRGPSNILACVVLTAAVFITYAQVLRFEFVTYDDPDYVTANAHVQAGFTAANIAWAFTSSFAGNWFPLTWLSHMLDWQLFRADAGMHHFVNVCIHALSSIILFLVLKRMTGAHWRSVLVAFLFALHPLHVESVAWVAERKDVLSALFWMLALLSYSFYAQRSTRGRYALTLLFFVLGLLSKPMVVTLPLVLILLDYWPLRRGRKLLEKLPFLGLSIAGCVITYIVHAQAGATASFEQIPLGIRIENALVSCVIYLWKFCWPLHLGVFYPYPLQSLVIPAIDAGTVLVVITVLILRMHPRLPYLTTGWLWYLITLAPVIGLIQVGAQARADRYTYIPSVGLAIAIVWGAAEALQRFPRARSAVAVTACVACVALTYVQVGYWRDSISLYEHAIAVAPDAYVPRVNLASVLESRGEHDEAIAQLREAVHTRPGFAIAHAELGQLLAENNQPEEALQQLETAIRLRPSLPDLHFGLGSVLGTLGRNAQAAGEFSKVIQLEPNNADAHYNLALALTQQDKLSEAEVEFQKTIQLAPDDANAHFGLGIALAKLGRMNEAIAQLSEAVRLKPDFKEAQQALAQMKGEPT